MCLQILEAFAADDSVFVQNCGRLMGLSNNIKTMSHYEFRNICDIKLESIGQRIACYQKVPVPYRVSTWGILIVSVKTHPQLSLNKQEKVLVCSTEEPRGELQAWLYPDVTVTRTWPLSFSCFPVLGVLSGWPFSFGDKRPPQ